MPIVNEASVQEAYAQYGLDSAGNFASTQPQPAPVTTPQTTQPAPQPTSGPQGFGSSAQVMLNNSAPPISEAQVNSMADAWANALPETATPEERAEHMAKLEEALKLDGYVPAPEDTRSPQLQEFDTAFAPPEDAAGYGQIDMRGWIDQSLSIEDQAVIQEGLQSWAQTVGVPQATGAAFLEEMLRNSVPAMEANARSVEARQEWNYQQREALIRHAGSEAAAEALMVKARDVAFLFGDRGYVQEMAALGLLGAYPTVIRLAQLADIKAARPKK